MIRLRVKKDHSGFDIRAYDGRKRVGHLGTVLTSTFNEVWVTQVAPEYRRRGIATLMYLEAAAQGCALERPRPLRSPRYARSREAHALWQSLVRSGLAIEDERGDMLLGCGL